MELSPVEGAMAKGLVEKVESSRARFGEVFDSIPGWKERQFAVNAHYASALVDLMYAPFSRRSTVETEC